MQIFEGKSVFGGIAMGKIRVYKKDAQQVKRVKVTDAEAEIARYMQARDTAMQQLQQLYEKALQEIGETNAAIFEVHQMMLEDDDYNESVENIIRTEQVNAEYAVASTGDNFAQMFASMDDEYMQGRAADVRDISERMIGILNGAAADGIAADEPVIIVADDLAPSETVQMDKSKVLSFVAVHGSLNSHTAILARTMGIPALVATDIAEADALDGRYAVVDGAAGKLYVEPDEETTGMLEQKKKEFQEQKELLETLKGKENITLDGKKIMLYANIGNSKDLATVIQNDAGGIGLFRSEFIYLERDHFPTEEELLGSGEEVPLTLGYVVYMADQAREINKSEPFVSINQNVEAIGFRALLQSGKMICQNDGDDVYSCYQLPEETPKMLAGDYILTEQGNVWYMNERMDVEKVYDGGDIIAVSPTQMPGHCMGYTQNEQTVEW